MSRAGKKNYSTFRRDRRENHGFLGAEFFFVLFGGEGGICYTFAKFPNFHQTQPPKFPPKPNPSQNPKTADAAVKILSQALANARRCAVDAACNFARFVVNESRTRLTTPPPPPLGICGSIAAAARIFGLALLLTTSGALAVANDALAHSDSCGAGKTATRLDGVCVETKYLGFADWCEKKISDSSEHKGFFVGTAPRTEYGAVLRGPNRCYVTKQNGDFPDFPWCSPFRLIQKLFTHSTPPHNLRECGWNNRYSDGSCELPATHPDSYDPDTHACAVCPAGKRFTALKTGVCIDEKHLGFADWCERKLKADGHSNGQAYENAAGFVFCAVGRSIAQGWCNPFPFNGYFNQQEGGTVPGGLFCGGFRNAPDDGIFSDGTCGFPATDPNSYNPDTHACRACSDIPGFTADPQGVCQPDRDCAAEDRAQANPYACGECLIGFTEDSEGACRANQNCAAQSRVQASAHACGACLPGFPEGPGGACNCPDGNARGEYGDCGAPRLTHQTACEGTDPLANPIGGTWDGNFCLHRNEHFHNDERGACIPVNNIGSASCADNYARMRQLQCVARGLLYALTPGSVIEILPHCVCPSTGGKSTSLCPDILMLTVFISDSSGGTVSAGWSGDSDLQSGEAAPSGARVTFTAVADDGYEFTEWSGDCGSASGTVCVAAPALAAVTVGASFACVEDFHNAAATGHLAGVSCHLTDLGTDPNLLNAQMETPLNLAVAGGHSEAARLLIDFGGHHGSACAGDEVVNPNAVSPPCLGSRSVSIHFSSGGTVSASWDGASDLRSGGLVASGATVTFSATAYEGHVFGRWSGACAAESGSRCLVGVTVDATVGAEFDCADFHQSALNGILAGVVCNLPDRDINEIGSSGWTPLHLAAQQGHAEIVSALLAEGANPTPVDLFLSTPLHQAARNGHLEVVNLLLANEPMADINATTFFGGITPLGEAQNWRQEAVILRLIELGGHYGTPCEAPDRVNPGSASPPCLDYEAVRFSWSGEGTVSVSWAEDADLQSGEAVPDGTAVTFSATAGEGHRFSLWTGACADELDSECAFGVTMDVTVGAEFGCADFHLSAGTAKSLAGVRCNLAEPGADADELSGGSNAGETPLMRAAAFGNFTIAAALLSAGANVNARSPDGETPLHFSARHGEAEVMALLLSAGASLNLRRSDNGWSPFFTAIAFERLAAGEILAENGADPDLADNGLGFTPLHYSLFRGRSHLIPPLVSLGLNVNATTAAGETVLTRALVEDVPEVAPFLILAGAHHGTECDLPEVVNWAASDPPCVEGVLVSLEFSSSAGGTLSVSWSGDSDAQSGEEVPGGAVRFAALAEDGFRLTLWGGLCAGVDASESECVRAVTTAATVRADFGCLDFHASAGAPGSLAGVRCNLSAGAEVDVRDAEGRTPLYHAAGRSATIVQLLVENNADVNAPKNAGNNRGQTPLHNAVIAGFERAESLGLLLSAGASVNAQDDLGETPLFEAVKNGGGERAGLMMILLENNADPNLAENGAGWTPLHFAVDRGYADAVSILASRASVNAEAANGDRPLDLAIRTNPHFVPVLIAAGANHGEECVPPDEVNPESSEPPCLDYDSVSYGSSSGGMLSVSWSGDADLQSGDAVADGAAVTFAALAEDGHELTLWSGACAGDSVSDARCVLAVTMDVTVGAEFGCLDFHASAAAGDLAGLGCNAAAGADVNAPDESGKTPLHLAAGEGHLEAVQKLLTLGATLNASDADGDTPLTEALDGGHAEIFNLLAAAGGMHQGQACGPLEVPNPDRVSPPCVSCGADEIISDGVCESCGLGEVVSGGACECDSGHRRINEICVHETESLPEDRTTCAEVFGGEWVDLSAAHGVGKGVCSGVDINDTFCLAGTVSALPCLGLFNHVRSCNLLGRPALDPWHCGKACAGGKASGARCLE